MFTFHLFCLLSNHLTSDRRLIHEQYFSSVYLEPTPARCSVQLAVLVSCLPSPRVKWPCSHTSHIKLLCIDSCTCPVDGGIDRLVYIIYDGGDPKHPDWIGNQRVPTVHLEAEIQKKTYWYIASLERRACSFTTCAAVWFSVCACSDVGSLWRICSLPSSECKWVTVVSLSLLYL